MTSRSTCVRPAKWDGAKLVIATTVTREGQASDSTQTWSLDASGNLIIESRAGGQNSPPVTRKTTYKKT